MLFHLKEPEYKTEAPNDVVTRFYGRSPEQILTALDYYRERARNNPRGLDDPEIVWWLKKQFSKGDIEEVQKGDFHFFSGMIAIRNEDGDKPLFDELKVTNDFSVYVPEDNVGTFAMWRLGIMNKERGGLYKLENPIEFFMNLSFVPEDIAYAVVGYDLTSYSKAIKENMKLRGALSQHPLVQVDGLQRILEDQQRKINESIRDRTSLQ